MQGATILGVGVGGLAAVMAVLKDNPFWKWLAIGILAVAVIIVLYILVLKLKDKAKSGPFASLIAKAGSGRGAVDPAAKARMDDLRKKFEEGVSTFKSAGKDLYSLPWFLLVGPSGSGKTEAMRHCNVGFPPGLQDCLQGTGGTMNMHWWFTNHAVVLDTAGRMFMEEGTDGQATEWKEFMKLLKQCRPNAPINGMLLVISAESLLKDSAEKIEQTAGAIARQLDVVQRTLEVRFPVFVVVTKCDKIVGFRDFFETINDPNLQHQILGWSNPAPLDDAFKPDQVDKHLDGVRQKLLSRRMGLLQNPIHTMDPSARRTDQVDEMFELPDNLVRIAPRLRRYLEMIFVAGEWSPKPLFLRGIYFTSSMREGQALDVGLAEALGIDVESIPGGKEWDKDKAYFLRDVFMSKVFKERGLVTRAANVSKALAKQRRMVVGLSAAAVIVLAGVAAMGYFGFKGSLDRPSRFWSTVNAAYAGIEEGENEFDALEVRLIDPKTLAYRGNVQFEKVPGDANFRTPLELVLASAKQRKDEIKPPFIAAPVVGFKSEWTEKQVNAHRAIVERAIVVPLVNATRSKLQTETAWGDAAVGSLAQLMRLQTYALGAAPAATDAKKPVAINVDVMFRYLLGEDDQRVYESSRSDIAEAVALAYPEGWNSKNLPAEVLGGKDEWSIRTVEGAVDSLVKHLEQLGKDRPDSRMASLIKLRDGLLTIAGEHANVQGMEAIKTAEGLPQTLRQYESFETQFLASADKILKGRADIDLAVKKLGDKEVSVLVTEAGDELQKQLTAYFNDLQGQLPTIPEDEKAAEKIDRSLVSLRGKLEESARRVDATVKQQLTAMSAAMENVKWLLTPGSIIDRGDMRAYGAIAKAYEFGARELRAADAQASKAAEPSDTGEARPTLVAQIAEVNENAKKVRGDVDALTGWSPEPGRVAPQALTAMRDQTVAALRTVTTIAASRRVHELVKVAIGEWRGDADGLRAHVEDVANARLAEGTFDARKLKRPRLPLTAMERPSEFAKPYHWEAAGQVLKDWAEVRAFVEGTDKKVVLGRDELRNDPKVNYTAKANATVEYMRDYIAYWRKQANEECRPAASSWMAYGQTLKATNFDKLCEDLEALEKIVREAFKVAPADMAKDALAETDGAYAKLADAKFLRRAKAVVALWGTLSENDADGARRELLSAMREGRIGDEYFGVYSADGLRFVNELIHAGLSCLVKETRRDLESAMDRLMTDAKAVPLAFVPSCDPVRTKPLTAAQVKDILGAADKLEQAAGSDRGASTAAIPEELRPLMKSLTGGDIMPAGSAVWFANLKAMAGLFSQQKELSFTVTFSPVNKLPARSGVTDDARGNLYGYAKLVVGGQAAGEVFSLTIPSLPEKLKERSVKLPLVDGQATELWLYASEPQGNQEPAEKIILPGNWSLLQQMMSACGEAEQDDKDPQSWRVMVTTKDNKYLWLHLTFNQKLPAKDAWPSTDRWPAR
ncbi:MAG TPA: type VI secretion protein IcmF/TssM N-terminal domain-containing protein [Phycisphaerales bacterium]|nr:type VI secretion protein IcmF/TssM N-terminal domain-containing protein [Phycisphaerales bacterium]